MPPPINLKEVKQFLGLAIYCNVSFSLLGAQLVGYMYNNIRPNQCIIYELLLIIISY